MADDRKPEGRLWLMALPLVVLVLGVVSLSGVGAQEAAEDAMPEDDADPALFNRLFEQVMAHPAPPAAPDQPLPFSHEWHVGEVGLDCTTCHTNPDPGRLMTFAATETCMQCHAEIGTDKQPIQRLTEYHNAHEVVSWVRVYEVMPGVNWSHRTHVDAGVGCLNCHGSVPEMPQVREITTVTGMASCQSCHQAQQAPNTCVTCHSWPDDQMIQSVR